MLERKRFFAWLLCAVMALALAVSCAYAVLAVGHSCEGDCCKICEMVAKTEAVLRSFALFAAVLALAFFSLHIPQAVCAGGEKRSVFQNTPVRWKVRLNN